jgi:hypothetical protein
VTVCKTCGLWARDAADRLEDHHPLCPDQLPELTAEERAAMDGLPKDFLLRIFRGERPVTDPTTFAN